MASKTVLLALAATVGARAARLETKEEMVAFLRVVVPYGVVANSGACRGKGI